MNKFSKLLTQSVVSCVGFMLDEDEWPRMKELIAKENSNKS